jgi:G3E family GTPase
VRKAQFRYATMLIGNPEKYNPDRIIIECSGSAFPATLAFQIRELERQTNGGLKLDSIVTVIDAENFMGYEDTSPTAKMQASYTDIILIVSFNTLPHSDPNQSLQNKWEHVSERQLDAVLDHLHTLNDLTPKIRCKGREVDPNLIFGLESRLFQDKDAYSVPSHNDEVETLRIGGASSHQHTDSCHCETTSRNGYVIPTPIDREKLEEALQILPKESVWRVKGFVRFSDGKNYILNWAFGRYDLTTSTEKEENAIELTVMGERGEVRRAIKPFTRVLGIP